MKHYKLSAFTLVELIVVITIVGILSTIGFVSYSGYLTGARDSNRMSQMVKLSDSLQVYAATKSLPLPDNYIEITANGASNVIAYQGEVGVDVLETIDYTNGGKDPKDDSYFTYYLTKDRKHMQLLTLFEEQFASNSLLTQSYANNYEDRYPKVYGKKLGVLTDTSNTPIQEITTIKSAGTLDIVTTGDTYIAHITDTDTLEGTGGTLAGAIPNGSCKRIKQTGGSRGNGIYTINPEGAGTEKVYCNMEVEGGGWTLIAKSYLSDTAFGSDVTATNDSYQRASHFLNISYSEALIASYSGNNSIQNYESGAASGLSANTFSGGTVGAGSVSGGTFAGELGLFFVK